MTNPKVFRHKKPVDQEVHLVVANVAQQRAVALVEVVAEGGQRAADQSEMSSVVT